MVTESGNCSGMFCALDPWPLRSEKKQYDVYVCVSLPKERPNHFSVCVRERDFEAPYGCFFSFYLFSSLPPLSLCGMLTFQNVTDGTYNEGSSSRSLGETCWTMFVELCVWWDELECCCWCSGQVPAGVVIPLSNIRKFSQDLTCPALCSPIEFVLFLVGGYKFKLAVLLFHTK